MEGRAERSLWIRKYVNMINVESSYWVGKGVLLERRRRSDLKAVEVQIIFNRCTFRNFCKFVDLRMVFLAGKREFIERRIGSEAIGGQAVKFNRCTIWDGFILEVETCRYFAQSQIITVGGGSLCAPSVYAP